MTVAQKTASNPAHSVWVSASAGTGKTKVLTDRVLRLLIEGVDPGAILCLTYTNAAAVEMSNRIYQSLKSWVVMDQLELEEHLKELHDKVNDQMLDRARTLFAYVLEDAEGLKIQTIHSFCQHIMRRFPLEMGVSPNFTIMDERTSEELIAQAWIDLVASQCEDEALNQSIGVLASILHQKSLAEVMMHVVANRARFSRFLDGLSDANLEDEITELLAIKHYNHDELIESWLNTYLYNKPYWKDLAEKLCVSAKKTTQSFGVKLKGLMEAFNQRKLDDNQLNTFILLFLTSSGGIRKRLVTNDVDLADREKLAKLQLAVVDLNNDIKNLHTRFYTVHLVRVTKAIIQRYNEAKQLRSMLDYDDLISLTLNLLQTQDIAPWVLFKLDGEIDHLLVDEAQDTSPEQWLLIQKITDEFYEAHQYHRHRSLFVVGDEKQSIYGFQGADVAQFSIKHDFFKGQAERYKKSWETVSLDTCFRSTQAVLDVVDYLFNQEHLKHSVTSHLEPLKHESFRKGIKGAVTIWPLCEGDEPKALDPWPLPTHYVEITSVESKWAEQIATTIKGWLDKKRVLPAKGRAVTPGDIMILFKSRNKLIHQVAKALSFCGVPVAGVDRLVLTESLAVRDLIALAHFKLLPNDDLNLACVLKSPLINISEDHLFELAHGRNELSLWEVLSSKSEQHDDFAKAYDYLLPLLSRVDLVTPYDFFSHILVSLEGTSHFIHSHGDDVSEVLETFLALTLEYEQSHTPSMQGFLHWIQSSDLLVKRDMEQGVDKVRLMTVHGSKGLQAPVVIMPDTTKKSSPPAIAPLVFAQTNNGEVPLWVPNSDLQNSLIHDIKSQSKNAEINEYYRLLYVAMTRAEDELYIGGAVAYNKQADDGSWYNVVKSIMKDIAPENDDSVHVYEVGSALNVTQTDGVAFVENNQIPIPDWIHTPVKENENFRLLSPSVYESEQKMHGAGEEGGLAKGILIHRLLQYAPTIEYASREDFIKTELTNLNVDDAEEIIAIVIGVIDKYSEFFNSNSYAEVAVLGHVEGDVYSGKIDRIVVSESHVDILDYKTNRSVPQSKSQVPVSYIKQMQIYKDLVQQIYTDKDVRCFLLWTETLELMAV